MTHQPRSPDAAAMAAGFMALIVSVLAVIIWHQALDFDPCDNVIKAAGADCLEPGVTGLIVGAVLVLFGGSIAWGAVRNGRVAFGNWLEVIIYAWLGVMVAVIGSGFAYAQWTLGL
ncbi:MAG: hypothetical protein AAFR64_07305 [Pseudomonadota bacterium]